MQKARLAQKLVDEHREWPIEKLAIELRCKPGHFSRLIRLNYLAPDVVTAIFDGTQPTNFTRDVLLKANLPMEWPIQRKLSAFPHRKGPFRHGSCLGGECGPAVRSDRRKSPKRKRWGRETMIELIVSGIIGGIIGAATTYFGFRLQRESDLKSLARACLIELDSLAEDELVADQTFYRPLLAQWKAGGTIADSEQLAAVFGGGPQEQFPVYYANVGEVGRFPASVSTPLIRYHRLRCGLMAAASRVLLAQSMDDETVRVIATAFEQQYERMMSHKLAAISALRQMTGLPPEGSTSENR